MVVFGHTHHPERYTDNGTLWVNPGECGGWLTGRATVTILETDTMEVEFVELGQTIGASKVTPFRHTQE